VDESFRSSTVGLTNGIVRISVWVDWLEGEMGADLRAVGGPEVPTERLVDLKRAKGLKLRRLPRALSKGGLVSRLEKLWQVLTTQAADILEGTETGLARLAPAASKNE
jgi:hypothetical protein